MEEKLATNFPESLDTLNNPSSTDSLSGHAAQHQNANDAIEALQSKVGIDGSTDQNSLDYKVSSLESQVNNIGNNSTNIVELFGLDGNNDLIVTGIENKTVIDSFSKTVFSTIRYVLQFTKNAEILSEAIDVINDGDSFHINEYEISSNTSNQLATVTLEENSGIINLCVTPVSGTVNVRFYRTALRSN